MGSTATHSPHLGNPSHHRSCGLRGPSRACEEQGDLAASKTHNDLSAPPFSQPPPQSSVLSGYRQTLFGQLQAHTHPYHHPALVCTSCPGHLAPFAISHLFVRFFNCIGTHLLLIIVVSPAQRGDPGHSSRSELFVGGMTEEAGEWAEEVGVARVWGSDRFGERSRLRPTSCVTLGRSLPGKPFPVGVSSSLGQLSSRWV